MGLEGCHFYVCTLGKNLFLQSLLTHFTPGKGVFLYAHLMMGRIMVWAPSVNLYLVNAISYEKIDPASPNSVCGLFMGRSRMSLYLRHLDLLSRSLGPTQCISL